MLQIYDVATARRCILKRKILEDYAVPPAVAERLKALFGAPISPAEAVARILDDIRKEGDPALYRWELALDGSALPSLRIPAEELAAALTGLPADLRRALEQSAERVREFYRRQPLTSWVSQELGGTLGQLIRPIRRVGLYIPAGTSPLPSTVIMSAVPAQVAGV